MFWFTFSIAHIFQSFCVASFCLIPSPYTHISERKIFFPYYKWIIRTFLCSHCEFNNFYLVFFCFFNILFVLCTCCSYFFRYVYLVRINSCYLSMLNNFMHSIYYDFFFLLYRRKEEMKEKNSFFSRYLNESTTMFFFGNIWVVSAAVSDSISKRFTFSKWTQKRRLVDGTCKGGPKKFSFWSYLERESAESRSKPFLPDFERVSDEKFDQNAKILLTKFWRKGKFPKSCSNCHQNDFPAILGG